MITSDYNNYSNQQRQPLHERPLVARRTKIRDRFVEDGSPVDSLADAVSVFRRYLKEKRGTKWIHENGSKKAAHKYNGAYADKKYARGMDGVKELHERSEGLQTVMLTLRAYEFNANDEGRAFVDHLQDLLASNKSVMNALRYHLTEKQGLDFGRLSVIQPHDTGYAHIQHGLWIEGEINREDLQPAIDAHLRHCPVACEKNHRGQAITIRRASSERVSTGLFKELQKDLIGNGDCLTSNDPHERRKYERLGAILMAANVAQWRPDRGLFREAMDEGTEQYKRNNIDVCGKREGIQFSEGGEVHDPAELAGAGGESMMVEVSEVDPDDDPIPSVS